MDQHNHARHCEPVTLSGIALISGTAQGQLLFSRTPLSFWGGIDPQTGAIIDQQHPLAGSCVAGRVLAIPSGRGSCSGSGILLELLLNGCNPAALVFEREETILTLGVVVAREFFGKSVPVVQLSGKGFAAIETAELVLIEGGIIRCVEEAVVNEQKEGVAHSLSYGAELELPDDFTLTAFDRQILAGSLGKAAEVAMRVVLQMALIQGAQSLIDVTQAHIDGCIYTGPASLLFAEQLCSWSAKVRVPSTLNSISIDRQRWFDQGVPSSQAGPAAKLADAYVRMGARPTYTCAPYQLSSAPAKGEQIMWAESNAVVYANSVLGARTMKYPDFMDICVALTGRAPNIGCHIASNRQARIKISTPPIEGADDALFPVLGYMVGDIAANRIPIVTGLEVLAGRVSEDDLKAFGAAFATTSSAPMFHIAGITPEASTAGDIAWHLRTTTSAVITHADLAACWRQLDRAMEIDVGLISLGNPHFSYNEIAGLSRLCSGLVKSGKVTVIITCGRDTYARAERDGHIASLTTFGVQIVTDTCWCMISEPIIPADVGVIMTNSAKYAHYGAGLTRRRMRFGSLEHCVGAACCGRAEKKVPIWLGDSWWAGC